jgi:hypothetical protein
MAGVVCTVCVYTGMYDSPEYKLMLEAYKMTELTKAVSLTFLHTSTVSQL